MEKEYLDEDKYQKVKKGLIFLGIIILLAAILISYFFVLSDGFRINKEAENYPIPTQAEVDEQVQTIEDKYTSLKEDLETKYDALEEDLNSRYDTLEEDIETKYTKEMGDDGWYEESAQKAEEIFDLNSQKNEEWQELEIEKSAESLDLTSAETSEIFETESSIHSAKFEKTKLRGEARSKFMIGGFIIFVGIIFATFLFFAAFGRNILAFGDQTTIPLQQEKMKKMAPTYGEVGGTVAKDIAKGIKEGLNEADSKNK
jgi:hypothetical protein